MGVFLGGGVLVVRDECLNLLYVLLALFCIGFIRGGL